MRPDHTGSRHGGAPGGARPGSEPDCYHLPMRRIAPLLLTVSTLLLAAPPSSAGTEEPASILVVIRADAGGVEIVSARPSHRPASWSGAPIDVPTRRTRFADGAGPDGAPIGGPVVLDGGAARVSLPNHRAGSRLRVRVDGQVHDLLVPGLDEERGGEPDPPEPELFEVQLSGDPEERQDIVFLSDGYREEERGAFLADVETNLEYLETLEPYSRYLPLINVYAVFLPSEESGADHLETAPQSFVDTALGCQFGAYGIAHLLDCDLGSVLALAGEAPGDDVRVVLVNDPAYGGSGDEYFAAVSTHPEMIRLTAHEMGHSDGGLADEYDGGLLSGGAHVESPNCHWEDAGTPWQPWIDASSPGVDAFEACWYSDYYRPTDDACMMKTLQDGFCVVCREQLTRTILHHVDSMVVGMTPASGVIEEPVPWDGVATFSLDLLEVNGDGLTVIWDWVEGEQELARGPNLSSIEIGGLDLAEGVQTIRVRVQDRIGWVLSNVPGAMAFETQFQVEFLDTGGSDDDDDDDGGSGCQDGSSGDGDGCGDDDDGGGFSRTALPIVIPLLLLGRRRQR